MVIGYDKCLNNSDDYVEEQCNTFTLRFNKNVFLIYILLVLIQVVSKSEVKGVKAPKILGKLQIFI